MTHDQLKELAQRLRDHAADYAAYPDDACKHSDLLAAADYLRKARYGGHVVERRYVGNALSEYRLVFGGEGGAR